MKSNTEARMSRDIIIQKLDWLFDTFEHESGAFNLASIRALKEHAKEIKASLSALVKPDIYALIAEVTGEVLEDVKRYKAFSDFIFESLNVDTETTSITIQHPTKGEYPINLKEVQDDLDTAIKTFAEKLTAALRDKGV